MQRERGQAQGGVAEQKRVTPADKDAAAALLGQLKTPPEVAHQIGVHVATLYRWMAEDSDFSAKIHRSRTRFLATHCASVGLAALLNIVESETKVVEGVVLPGAPAAVRRAAARDLMEFGGHTAAAAAAEAAQGQIAAQLHEMTPDQLERHIASARGALVELRRQVSTIDGVAEPVIPPVAPDVAPNANPVGDDNPSKDGLW